MTTHIKLTPHFLEQANARMPRGDILQLWDLVLTGVLFEAAEKLNGDNGAVSLGQSWVVFCIDQRDAHVLVLKTALRPSQSEIIGRRTDTRIVRLPSLTERNVDAGGLAVRQTLIGVELSTPDGEIVLGLTDEEAEDLYQSLGLMLGAHAKQEETPSIPEQEE